MLEIRQTYMLFENIFHIVCTLNIIYKKINLDNLS